MPDFFTLADVFGEDWPLLAPVSTAIKDLLLEVAQRPLGYASENELRARLMARLLQYPQLTGPEPTGIPRRFRKRLAQIGRARPADLTAYHESVYRVPPLQMHYGANTFRPKHIDFAVLNPNDISRIVTPRLQDAEHKYLAPLVGIRLATEKSGWKFKPRHFECDAMRLNECKYAYVVNIMRNQSLGRRTGKRQFRISAFCEALEEAAERHKGITWIGLIVHTAFADVEFLTFENDWERLTNSHGGSGLEEAVRHVLICSRYCPVMKDTETGATDAPVTAGCGECGALHPKE